MQKTHSNESQDKKLTPDLKSSKLTSDGNVEGQMYIHGDTNCRDIGGDIGGDNGGLSVKIQNFEGPLALLLSLVKQHKMDIYDIPIALITDQYLLYLSQTIEHTLDDLTSFYQMAAWLLQIKSHMLLPVNTDITEEEIDDPRTELIHTLIEYQKHKQLSYLLETKHDEFTWTSLRDTAPELSIEVSKEEVWKEIEAMELLATFVKLFEKHNAAGMKHIVDLREKVTVKEKITYLLELLTKNENCSFKDVVGKEGGVLSLVCSFLAILELVKQQVIKIMQHVFQGDIIISKKI